MRKSKIKQISLAVCLALMPYSSFAAGLGKLNVSSGLGEPLKAEVELLSVSADELSTLIAAIANEEAYAAQGIPRLGIHNAIKVELSKDATGSPVLKLYSTQPISDPYLDMLIQVDWASGRLQREYTVLLDPPGYKQATEDPSLAPIALPSPANTQSSTPYSQTPKSADTGVSPAPKGKKSKHTAAVAAEKTEVANDQELVTKRGDSLSAIAKQVQVEGVSLDQMLVGLYENNKEAFSRDNMNRLKVGKIIKVPTKEALLAVDSKQAHESVKVHSANWNAYRNTLAGAVAAAPVAVEAESKQAASGKIATAEDKAAPVKAGPKDVVKLSAGDKDLAKAGKDAAKLADAKAAAAQEESIARGKELKDAKDRATALEKQIQDMQKLLALKSQTMQALQKNAELATKPAETKPAEAKATEAKPAEVKPVTETKPAEVKPTDVKTEAVKAEPAPEATVKPAEEKPAVAKPAKEHKKVIPPPAPSPEPSFIDGLMNVADLSIIGAAGAVGIFGALWMYLRNKRRKDLDSFERGILTSGGLRANTVFGNTTGTATNADTSFLTDFAQSANGSMIDANDVDPIAEAEVYMAYGRDAQAEEILKDAISKEPKRYELHLKLLEIYAGQRDASAFVAIAGELYTTLGADDPTWAKVAAMGAELEPDNPLYKLANAGGGAAVAEAKKLDAADFDDVAVMSEEGLDFSLDDMMSNNTVTADPASSDAGSLASMDFTSLSSPAAEPAAADSVAMPSLDLDMPPADNSVNFEPASESTLDFDLGAIADTSLDLPETTVASAEPDTSSEKVMDFDLGSFGMDSAASAEPEVAEATTAIEDSFSSLPELETASESVIDFSPSTIAEPAAEALNAETLDFELPMQAPADDTASAAAGADADFTFDFPLETTAPAVEVATDAAESDVQTASAAVASAISDISFDLDALPSAADSSVADLASEATEISFDLPEVEPVSVSKAAEVPVADAAATDANEFDLSGISLDLDDELHASTIDLSAVADEQSEAAGQEPPDVEIKLDLVAAYIDMDDKEGARELLEEVMQEGGPQQQARAQQLLDSLA